MIEVLKDPLVMGILALVSAVTATLAAYCSWRQIIIQKRRWNAEDARKNPNVFIALSGEYSSEGWFHGVWHITNRADYEIQLINIEAVRPRRLRIGSLDPASDGPVGGMKVMNPSKVIKIEEIIRPSRPPSETGHVGNNFLYRLSNTPERDRGASIQLRFHIREVENPDIRYVKYGEAVIPGMANT